MTSNGALNKHSCQISAPQPAYSWLAQEAEQIQNPSWKFNNSINLASWRLISCNRDFAFFCVWTNETSASRNLRSYLVLQRLCNEAALSPGIDAFLY